ncbi:MAG: 16S rRNA (cytosine(967)-C(5))-methyltransferase RsmB [Defluviitaleaceae bacterium]|nr:16S rRNA (cytosine(967)-C(5))-methyltransferase RsmB [Defluviitaleaceae bacterium]
MIKIDIKKSERAVAVAVLSEVLEEGAYANIALRKALAKESEALPRARAFVTELVNETLRNLLLIDHVINDFSKTTPVEKMKPFIRNLLRVSVCQLRHMEKIPDRAAVNEAVVLAKAYGFTNLSGFVNGVLRAISRQPNKPVLPKINPTKPATLALHFSYPKWMVTNLTRWLGKENIVEFLRNSHNPPPVTIHANTFKISAEELMQVLAEEGVEATPVETGFGTNAWPILSLRHTGDISMLKAFRDGLFFVMDPGALHAVHALDPKPGQTILDLCAAPGGKSFAMACMMENSGIIRSYDIHGFRVELISQTRRKLGLSIIEASVQDALIHNPALDEAADAVLLDAPCSGLGTIRKHPEIKYARSPSGIKELAEKQFQMLSNASKYVKPGGVLVYCTCTVSSMENVDNVNKFLEAHPGFFLENSRQIMPGSYSDGFFIALIRQNPRNFPKMPCGGLQTTL